MTVLTEVYGVQRPCHPARRVGSPSVPPAKGTRPQHCLGIIKNAAKIMKEEYGKGKRRKPLKVKAPDLEKS
ncbi:hypothetical protein GQ600_1778 [Phytophthora cactorum]|nr:hypothetical protein GQ600_1778 [Phytophthora cactorum]